MKALGHWELTILEDSHNHRPSRERGVRPNYRRHLRNFYPVIEQRIQTLSNKADMTATRIASDIQKDLTLITAPDGTPMKYTQGCAKHPTRASQNQVRTV